jgi:osmotically-inducible protein OsmY
MMSARTLSGAAATLLAASLLGAVAATLLAGCAPAVIAVGVGATAMLAVDRRTTGAQVDDQSIELKILTEAGTSWGSDIHLNVTSFNGNVLLSGEVPTPEIRNEILQLAKRTEKVRNVHDELVVGAVADLGARSNDTYLTSAVKTRLIESEVVGAIYIKVVTERRVVYLMGIVSRTEGDTAARIAATTSGVGRVVKLFEYTS